MACGITTIGSWKQGDLKEDEINHHRDEDVMVKLVELPKRASIVECKDLQEGRRHYEG